MSTEIILVVVLLLLMIFLAWVPESRWNYRKERRRAKIKIHEDKTKARQLRQK